MGVDYECTLIAVAPDCPVDRGTVPPSTPEKPTVAAELYRLISQHPYELTSEDVLWAVHADKHGIPEADRERARHEYFSVGRACLRASPLGKRYGWGVHCDEQGRIALVGVETPEYAALVADEGTTVRPAMRSSR
jgi:hypothetical protein